MEISRGYSMSYKLGVLLPFSFVLVCSLAIPGFGQTRPAADLVVTHAKVWTVDPARPQAEAVAVIGERIVAVGSNAEIEQWRGPQTRVIDAGGRLLLPGFNDAHVHFISGGMELDAVQLKDATSPEEFARRIGEKAKTMPKGEWILEGNWDETKSPHLSREVADRPADARQPGVCIALRRTHGTGQFGGVAAGGHYCNDAGSTGRNNCAGRAGQPHRCAEGRSPGADGKGDSAVDA